MKLEAHAMADRKMFEQWLPSSISFAERMRTAAESGKGDIQFAYTELVHRCLQHACAALILGRGDDEALGFFRDAVRYGTSALEAPGGRDIRVHQVEVTVSERGANVTAIHEKPPRPGPQPMAIDAFSNVLNATVAFGDDEQRSKVASYPEEKYRSPDVEVSESLFQRYRGLKAWLRRDESVARRDLQGAMQTAKGGKGWIAAFLAMTEGDQRGFESNLEGRLKLHKKQYEKKNSDPMGFVCMDALALCRLAIDRGLRVDEWPYLPVRLLPNYKPVVH